MEKVAVVTDSTAYIPAELVKQHGLIVVPLSVIWDGKTLHDGVDITPSEFYARLKKSESMPTTSQTSPAEFAEIFSPLLAQEKSILAVLISSKLSGTIDSAMQVRRAMPTARIEIVDSLLVAMALGFTALTAARAVEGGADLIDAAKAARQAAKLSGAMFVVDTLEFLHRGGRIGGAKRYLGTALNLKPVLSVQEGKIEALESVRTKGKAVGRMLDLLEKQIGGKRPLRLSPLHAAAPDEAQALMEKVQKRFHPDECFISEVSPAIGAHVGPGTIAITWCAGI